MNLSTTLLLIRRQAGENKRIYALSAIVLVGFLGLMFLIIHQWKDSFSGATQHGVFLIGLFISGGVFSNSMFKEFSSKSGSIWLLCLPAKTSEKLITSIVFSVFLFIPTYLLIFYLVDSIYLYRTVGFDPKYILNPLKDNFYNFFFYYLLFNGIILLGRVIFTDYSLLKTILVSIISFVTLNYLNLGMLQCLLPNLTINSAIAFDSFQFTHFGENINVNLTSSNDKISAIFIRFILPVCLWFLVWLKLKEKEV